MNCPKCNGKTCVVDSRSRNSMAGLLRRRICRQCVHRFTTVEVMADNASERYELHEFVDEARMLAYRLQQCLKQFHPYTSSARNRKLNGMPPSKQRQLKPTQSRQ